jgi:hypothetical protein
MTKLLDKAIEAVRALSAENQDEIARAMLHLTHSEPEIVDLAHLPAILEGLSQAKSGKYASAAEVETAFRHFDR